MSIFKDINSKAIPWLAANIDTDVIIPMKRLILNQNELGYYSFEAYRFENGDGDNKVLNKNFILNNPDYRDAEILITGDNFGCGSSREAAPEAIRQSGIRCVISTGFADIFYNNCFEQGVLPIVLDQDRVFRLYTLAKKMCMFYVSLERSVIVLPDGGEFCFHVDPFKKECLLNNLDSVDRTKVYIDEINAFFMADKEKRPWLYVV